MVVACPQLLLSDVRNVVVPSLQYMLQSTSDHDELAKRLFRDPSLLVVGVGPLARLQYTLEQYRKGTASVAMGNLGAAVGPEASSATASGSADGGKATPARNKRKRVSATRDAPVMPMNLEEDQSRLLLPVIVPQVGGSGSHLRIGKTRFAARLRFWSGRRLSHWRLRPIGLDSLRE